MSASEISFLWCCAKLLFCVLFPMILGMGCYPMIRTKKESIFIDIINFEIFLIFVWIIPITLLLNFKIEPNEVNNTEIKIESINAYDQNLLEEYKIYATDKTKYDTKDKNIIVKESSDDDFHISKITLENKWYLGPLNFAISNNEKIKLEIPHDHYIMHTQNDEDKITQIYPVSSTNELINSS